MKIVQPSRLSSYCVFQVPLNAREWAIAKAHYIRTGIFPPPDDEDEVNEWTATFLCPGRDDDPTAQGVRRRSRAHISDQLSDLSTYPGGAEEVSGVLDSISGFVDEQCEFALFILQRGVSPGRRLVERDSSEMYRRVGSMAKHPAIDKKQLSECLAMIVIREAMHMAASSSLLDILEATVGRNRMWQMPDQEEIIMLRHQKRQFEAMPVEGFHWTCVRKAMGCLTCGVMEKAKLRKCARCLVAKYCSAACQNTDWVEHKGICRQVKELYVSRPRPGNLIQGCDLPPSVGESVS